MHHVPAVALLGAHREERIRFSEQRVLHIRELLSAQLQGQRPRVLRHPLLHRGVHDAPLCHTGGADVAARSQDLPDFKFDLPDLFVFIEPFYPLLQFVIHGHDEVMLLAKIILKGERLDPIRRKAVVHNFGPPQHLRCTPAGGRCQEGHDGERVRYFLTSGHILKGSRTQR